MSLRRVWSYLPQMPLRRVHKSRLGVGVVSAAALVALIPAAQPSSYANTAPRSQAATTSTGQAATTSTGQAATTSTGQAATTSTGQDATTPSVQAAVVPTGQFSATSPAQTTTGSAAYANLRRPLAGLTIAIDPGHNLGNASHPKQINRKVWVGLWKICNTTGTATNSGFPEATFNFSVATRLRRALQALGATVVMTRYVNSNGTWGPCIDYRGKFGKAQHAVLKVSIHADGAPARDRGFHIITPAFRRGYTDDIFRSSRRLGLAMRAGMLAGGVRLSNYIAHGWSVRGDQGTLNMSDIPTIIVETGNMRNARDAALETSRRGQEGYALALLRGIRLYLRR